MCKARLLTKRNVIFIGDMLFESRSVRRRIMIGTAPTCLIGAIAFLELSPPSGIDNTVSYSGYQSLKMQYLDTVPLKQRFRRMELPHVKRYFE